MPERCPHCRNRQLRGPIQYMHPSGQLELRWVCRGCERQWMLEVDFAQAKLDLETIPVEEVESQ